MVLNLLRLFRGPDLPDRVLALDTLYINGLAIVGIAIIFDRISQAYGARLQKHLEITHGQ